MEKTIDFYNCIEKIIKEFNLPFNISFSFEKFINSLSKNERVDIVIGRSTFRNYGIEITSLIKSIKYSTTIIEDDCNLFLPKTNVLVKSNKVIVFGNDDFIKGVNYCLRDNSCDIIAVYLSTHLESIFLSEYEVVFSGKHYTKKVKNLSQIILDSLFIKKSSKKDVLTAYISNVLIAPILIDYRLSKALNGKAYSPKLYIPLKQALRYTLEYSTYTNFYEVLCLASFIKSAINYSSDIINSSGAENIVKILNVTCEGVDKIIICKKAFEKTIKLYHFFFSNEFSNLLSYPDYVNDIEKLSMLLGISEEELYSSLNIPSQKRAELICWFLKKVRLDFLRETTSLMAILPKILGNFDKVSSGVITDNLSLENLKDAVKYSPYLTKRANVLTLMRDFGILSLIN